MPETKILEPISDKKFEDNTNVHQIFPNELEMTLFLYTGCQIKFEISKSILAK